MCMQMVEALRLPTAHTRGTTEFDFIWVAASRIDFYKLSGLLGRGNHSLALPWYFHFHSPSSVPQMNQTTFFQVGKRRRENHRSRPIRSSRAARDLPGPPGTSRDLPQPPASCQAQPALMPMHTARLGRYTQVGPPVGRRQTLRRWGSGRSPLQKVKVVARVEKRILSKQK